MVTTEIAALSIGTVFLSVFLSTVGSIIVANRTIENEAEARRERQREEWYRQTSTLVSRTEEDWYEVMNRGEASYEVVAHEKFTEWRDKIEEQAAKGRTMAVDEDIVGALKQAAADLNHAASTDEYYEIEQELLPILRAIQFISQKRIEEGS